MTNKLISNRNFDRTSADRIKNLQEGLKKAIDVLETVMMGHVAVTNNLSYTVANNLSFISNCISELYRVLEDNSGVKIE